MAKENFEQFAGELIQEKSLRSVVIIGSSRIDVTLSEIIAKLFLPKISKNRDSDELLEGDSALGTFSSRIKIAYRLGLIDASFYRQLDLIRKLRNSCAHRLNLNLKQKSLIDQMQMIINPIKSYKQFDDLKSKYFYKVEVGILEEIMIVFLTISLILDAIFESIKRIEPNAKYISITQCKEN